VTAHGARQLAKQFITFVGVGALGFLVDASLFVALTSSCCGWSIAWARATSATCSITTTWALNRRLTFADRRSANKGGEYLRYVFGQVIGLGVNLGTFTLCLLLVPQLKRTPLGALAIGAAAALLFNFMLARTVAFRKERSPPERDAHRSQ
jgi:putative flippase GtrA